ncbi:hypothetical protein DFH09DRAFT_1274912 [Mycena vulgaris]|nr:hypothetical protein DFH09DRAFT_1274912 [Mycena vulgaris]
MGLRRCCPIVEDLGQEAADGNGKAPIAEGSSEARAKRDVDKAAIKNRLRHGMSRKDATAIFQDFSELEDPASGKITDSGGNSDPASEKAQGWEQEQGQGS